MDENAVETLFPEGNSGAKRNARIQDRGIGALEKAIGKDAEDRHRLRTPVQNPDFGDPR